MIIWYSIPVPGLSNRSFLTSLNDTIIVKNPAQVRIPAPDWGFISVSIIIIVFPYDSYGRPLIMVVTLFLSELLYFYTDRIRIAGIDSHIIISIITLNFIVISRTSLYTCVHEAGIIAYLVI